MTGRNNDKPPKSVKVGWATYRIVEWTPPQGMSKRRYGECSNIEKEIRIDVCHGAAQTAHTLLHEILHAVCNIWWREEDDKEERTVEIIANGLSTVWRDNPEVMAWIAHHHKGIA